MLLAVKTVKNNWCVVVHVVCMVQVISCRQRLSGVCSKLVNQLSRVSLDSSLYCR